MKNKQRWRSNAAGRLSHHLGGVGVILAISVSTVWAAELPGLISTQGVMHGETRLGITDWHIPARCSWWMVSTAAPGDQPEAKPPYQELLNEWLTDPEKAKMMGTQDGTLCNPVLQPVGNLFVTNPQPVVAFPDPKIADDCEQYRMPEPTAAPLTGSTRRAGRTRSTTSGAPWCGFHAGRWMS
ncbi:MAG: hypothetical protein NTW21_42435 [Verrucomicrobia bacterium]|nr:hypothetical protein [Verrucomicrobiota bacterium]